MMRGVRGSRTVAIAGLLAARGLLAAAGAQPPAQENAPAAPAAEAPVAEVVVEGRHAGPRMWTVRSGDHVLWILGTVTPLPKKMIWQPDAVQTVLQQSQEVVPAWPAYGIGANPFTALRVYIEWRRLQKPPDHLPLQKTLPPALYARVEALEARYDPRDPTLEKLRPMLAAERLMTRVLDANGLALHNEVQQTVLRLAREQGVNVLVDLVPDQIPWLFSGVVVRKDDIAARRDLLTRFLKASIEGNDIALTDEKRAKEVLAKELKITSSKILDITYSDFKQQSPQNLEPSVEGAQNILKLFPNASQKVADYIDGSLLDGLKNDGFFAAMEKKYGLQNR